MYRGKKIIGIVTARGGSKGVPGKNIKRLGGKPLIEWTVDAALNSSFIDQTILSSDDADIISVARSVGCEVPFVRPSNLAEDTASSIDVITHALGEINDSYDYFVLLQPTSPFRTSKDIDDMIMACIDQEAPVLVAVEEIKTHPMFIYEIEDNGYLRSFIPQENQLRRQDVPNVYKHNGAFYMAKVSYFDRVKTFVGGDVRPYICYGHINIDIDTLDDWKYAEYILREKGL
ncbi:acylneuraminate cytidylyltransferase family protein [Halopseudomonas sp. SMJS2]|uniref:acylneuraminate cytidylyltransferase family protein n=1 Tax=Halopseudomonas sp. SMJS2 TaxID=3041098 RepID=UPI002452F559|nr:acylneuraminate cytidylyltransferase family protein [Halopseudomonas sp. SMJS2]WGK60366.1 acylneuraminate cytidylyltransferase family protein [Halopseudomonas sp. SMJS2]